MPRGAGVDGAVRGDGGVRAHRRDWAVARARRDEVGVGIVREARLHGLEVQEGHRAATRRRGEARAHERLAHRGVRAPHAERGGLQRDVAGREDGRRVPRQGAVRAAATRRGESARGERDDDSRIDERGRGPPRGQQARQVAPPARGGRGHPEDRASRGRADREKRARGTRRVAAAAPEPPPQVPSESERRPEVTRRKRPQRSDIVRRTFSDAGHRHHGGRARPDPPSAPRGERASSRRSPRRGRGLPRVSPPPLRLRLLRRRRADDHHARRLAPARARRREDRVGGALHRAKLRSRADHAQPRPPGSHDRGRERVPRSDPRRGPPRRLVRAADDAVPDGQHDARGDRPGARLRVRSRV